MLSLYVGSSVSLCHIEYLMSEKFLMLIVDEFGDALSCVQMSLSSAGCIKCPIYITLRCCVKSHLTVFSINS